MLSGNQREAHANIYTHLLLTYLHIYVYTHVLKSGIPLFCRMPKGKKPAVDSSDGEEEQLPASANFKRE